MTVQLREAEDGVREPRGDQQMREVGEGPLDSDPPTVIMRELIGSNTVRAAVRMRSSCIPLNCSNLRVKPPSPGF
jgi:hypothetical protein